MSSKENITERYQRQMILKGFGETAQQKLGQAKVLVVGAGGLGCPALLYLAGAGVGTLGIIDFDRVTLSNLHRQVLYTMEDIGHPKAVCAAHRLKALNDQLHLITYTERIDPANCIRIFSQFDIIIDGTDNFATRYMINDACALMEKPLIYGAVSQYEGQVAVFNEGPASANYRDIFPQPPKAGEVLNCAESGVLGVLPGLIGTMQANETIKLITGIGDVLVNRLYNFNVLTNQAYELDITPTQASKTFLPADINEFEQTNYEWLCGTMPDDLEISGPAFNELLRQQNVRVIDVREPGESPAITAFTHEKLPLSLIREKLSGLRAETIVFICQSGKRSLQAANWLKAINGPVKNIFSLQGGLINYQSPTNE
ncbi:HesA/MoeB/ThiF family protein [Flavihumibacter fluvii]|uniref:HesA/MoeB/ThiF family protein n=1 Tax=Flavihumibacter fluvii TaxID=2838157 RepID=UPI001BDE2C4F|nr:HesA/MoeB/ThiF family protein [Flavihumibacter fluvii]ULQ52741.1 HesA/MoeB/ThiF family protein [Flavihumibacter fluvii]